MSAKDTVINANCSNRSYIDTLSVEVMCRIFDQLDFESLKNCSLVGQRWNTIISRNGYVEKFVFKIDMDFNYEIPEEAQKQRVAEIGEVVSKTQRCYRLVKWNSEFWNDCQEILLIWNAIHPKITTNLHSLELHGANTAMTKWFYLIADALPSMTQLRSLILSISGYYDDLACPIILRSNSVNHLKAIVNFKITVEMPELQSFEGSFSSLYRPDRNRASFTLTELKHLIVKNFYSFEEENISNATARFIFRRLTKLQTLKWNQIEDEIFNELCENCTTLQELTIRSIATGSKNYRSKFHFDLKKLTKLSNLEFQSKTMEAVEPPNSLRQLKININYFNIRNMIDNIIGSSINLEELHVVFDTQLDLTVSLLHILSVLKRLEVLVFYGGRFNESSFLHVNAPLERMRQLRFIGCDLSTKSFCKIQEKFPNLKEPQFFERDSEFNNF